MVSDRVRVLGQRLFVHFGGALNHDRPRSGFSIDFAFSFSLVASGRHSTFPSQHPHFLKWDRARQETFRGDLNVLVNPMSRCTATSTKAVWPCSYRQQRE